MIHGNKPKLLNRIGSVGNSHRDDKNVSMEFPNDHSSIQCICALIASLNDPWLINIGKYKDHCICV